MESGVRQAQLAYGGDEIVPGGASKRGKGT